MSSAELRVDGMKCGGCSGRLKKVLEAAGGISLATIVLETKQVSVAYDETSIDESTIRKLISDAGFTIVAN